MAMRVSPNALILTSSDAIRDAALMAVRAKGFSLHIINDNTKEDCETWAKTIVDALAQECDVRWVGWHVLGNTYVVLLVDRKVVTSAKATDNKIDIQTRQRFRLKIDVPSDAIANKLKRAARLKRFASGWTSFAP